MTVIENSISPTSESYQANRAGMLAQIARVNAVVGRTVAASELSKKRFHERGQLLPRERIALLLDAGAPFLELSALAGYCLDTPDPDKSIPGGGTIAGIGFVSGVRCMVTASDSGIEAGSLQPEYRHRAAALPVARRDRAKSRVRRSKSDLLQEALKPDWRFRPQEIVADARPIPLLMTAQQTL